MQPRQPSPPQTFPKSARICSRGEFDRAFKVKCRASDALMTVYVATNDGERARLGISASRRLGGAVVRNRVKRLVREVFRRLRAALPAGTDWVVIPRRGDATLSEVEVSLRQLIGKLTGAVERLKSQAQKESTECLGGEPGAFRRGKKPKGMS